MTVVALSAYPLAPIQLTLISTLTIGIPGFFLALGPNTRRYVPGFLHRVLRFSVPAGLITGAGAYGGYAVCRWLEPASGVAGARTTATVVVLVVALWTLVILARPLHAWKVALIATMAALAAVAVTSSRRSGRASSCSRSRRRDRPAAGHRGGRRGAGGDRLAGVQCDCRERPRGVLRQRADRGRAERIDLSREAAQRAPARGSGAVPPAAWC